MIVLSVLGIRKHYGDEQVLSGVAFDVRPGDRIGLVGPNGTGKTTLLRILAGEVEADGGTVQWHPAARAEYLRQHPLIDPNRTLWEEAKSALKSLFALQHDAEQAARQLAECTDESEHRRLAVTTTSNRNCIGRTRTTWTIRWNGFSTGSASPPRGSTNPSKPSAAESRTV